VSLYETLLFLHDLSAFSLVAAVVLSTYLIVAATGSDRAAEVLWTLRLMRVGDAFPGSA
jgi:hypothetical protein